MSRKRSNHDIFLRAHDSYYTGPFPTFQKPVVQGYFSLDPDRTYRADLKELKYISLPPNLNDVFFDLNKGVEAAVANNDYCDEKVDNILKWISQNGKELEKIEPNSTFADIVCYRGLLTQVLCTPYEKQEGWIILATKYKGVIYLCAKETEERRLSREQATERQRRFMAWGFKFEQYMTSDRPGEKPNAEAPLSGKSEFCALFKTKLNTHRLLFGAEMDGVDSKTEINNLEDLKKAEFIELKTSRVMDYDKQFQNFLRYKLIKWWGQSFLVGIDRLLCGFRNDIGIVHEVEDYKVPQLSKMAKRAWDPSVCMNFCDSFLLFVRRVVKEEDPGTVWKFVWQPGSDVTYSKVPSPSEFSFLPLWFMDEATAAAQQ